MHYIQKTIIKRLMASRELRFSQLSEGFSADDNFVFHLKSLIQQGYVEKENNLYTITADGVKKTQDFDWKSLSEKGCKSLFVGYICESEGKFVIKKHDQAVIPFYNLPNGRPYHDVDLRNELVRIAKQEMNVDINFVDPVFDSVHMKDAVTSIGEILFSDVLVVYKINVSKIKDLPDNMVMLSKEEIGNLENRWKEIDYCLLRKDWKPYLEYRFVSDYIL